MHLPNTLVGTLLGRELEQSRGNLCFRIQLLSVDILSFWIDGSYDWGMYKHIPKILPYGQKDVKSETEGVINGY